jgi:hypothetical protein
MTEFKTAKDVTDAIAECLTKDVAAYLEHLKNDSPIVSTSHLRLRSLYRSYGKEAVDAETDRQFAAIAQEQNS